MIFFPSELQFANAGYTGGRRRIRLTEPFLAVTSLGTLTVPRGFISDGASIPKAAWSVVGHPFARFLEECVIHDWFYSSHNRFFTRLQGDNILRELMWNRGLPLWKVASFWLAVRLGGGRSFNQTTPPMNVTPEHWLEGVKRQPLEGGAPMGTRRFLVIHHTAGATGQSSIEYWEKLGNGVCAHLVIERDGTIIQCRPFDHTCGHAGPSQWRDRHTGRLYTGLNSCSIGIELANAGNAIGALSWARNQPGFGRIHATHKNGGRECEWETYPLAQLTACELVSQALVKRYNLDDIIGHEDCAPTRKVDPGPAFPMEALRQACGFRGLPPKLA